MTKGIIKSILLSIVNNFETSISDSTQLTQEQLTSLTDDLASNGLDTVNPNGPCYPSTPR